jgi:hypothetical protein
VRRRLAGRQLGEPGLQELNDYGPVRVLALIGEQLAELVGGQRADPVTKRRQREVVVVPERQAAVVMRRHDCLLYPFQASCRAAPAHRQTG